MIYCDILGYTGIYWDILGYTGICWDILVCTGKYTVPTLRQRTKNGFDFFSIANTSVMLD